MLRDVNSLVEQTWTNNILNFWAKLRWGLAQVGNGSLVHESSSQQLFPFWIRQLKKAQLTWSHTPSRESQCNVCLKTNHNGTLRIQEVTEVSAKLCKSAWDAVRQQSSISFNVRCFLLALKLGIILWTLHLCSHCIGYFEWFCWTTQWDASLPQSKWSDQPKIQVQPLVAHAAR